MEQRLRRYPHIADSFPVEVLRTGRDSPYAVHYLAWCLGVWCKESLFERLDRLLEIASAIPGWDEERKSLTKNPEYGMYFSLVWQLQVAEFMHSQGCRLQWQASGPDLRCVHEDQEFFVECYQPKGAHSVELFIDDILTSVGSDIEVHHDLFHPLKLPQNEASVLIDRALHHFVDQQALKERREAARLVHTDIVFEEGGLRIELNGGAEYEGRPDNAGLDPVEPIRRLLAKAIHAKADKNRLRDNRPNLLAVNTLLTDAQHEGSFERRIKFAGYPQFDLPDTLDAVAYSPVGINGELAAARFDLASPAPLGHPAHRLGLRWAGERYR